MRCGALHLHPCDARLGACPFAHLAVHGRAPFGGIARRFARGLCAGRFSVCQRFGRLCAPGNRQGLSYRSGLLSRNASAGRVPARRCARLCRQSARWSGLGHHPVLLQRRCVLSFCRRDGSLGAGYRRGAGHFADCQYRPVAAFLIGLRRRDPALDTPAPGKLWPGHGFGASLWAGSGNALVRAFARRWCAGLAFLHAQPECAYAGDLQ